MSVHVCSFDILQEFEPSLMVGMVGGDVEFPSDEDLVRREREMHTVPVLDASCWWQLESPLHWDVLVEPIVQMGSSLQGTEQVHKLKFIEPLVYIWVVVEGKLELVNVVPGDWQVFILP